MRFSGSPAGQALADERGSGIAMTPAGDLIATGWYEGNVDFGGGSQSVGGDNNAMFVARFGADGRHLVSRVFGDPNPGLLYAPHARGRAVAAGAEGSMLVGGQFAGGVDFGSGLLVSRETPLEADAGTDAALPVCFACRPDAVVFELDSAGATKWVRHFGSDGADITRALAVAGGNVIAAGTVEGSVDFGGGITAPAGAGDAFVLALDGSGNYVWARRFAGTGDDDAYGVATDAGGNIFVAGSFSESLSIGATTLSSPGHLGAFVAKLDAGGNPLWAKELVATQPALALDLAVDGAGAVVVVGSFRGTLNVGSTALTSAYDDAFVVKLDATGNAVFAKGLGGAQNDEADAVALDASGRVFVAGAAGSDRVDFGGGPITGGRSDDLFVVVLESDGGHICSRRYGGANGSSGSRSARDLRSFDRLAGELPSFGPDTNELVRGWVQAVRHNVYGFAL